MNYNKLLDSMTKKDENLGCGTYLVAFLIVVAIIFAFSCLNAWVALLLWDWVIVGVLGWVAPGVMTFWPMWGLVELCSILFKSKNFDTGNKED